MNPAFRTFVALVVGGYIVVMSGQLLVHLLPPLSESSWASSVAVLLYVGAPVAALAVLAPVWRPDVASSGVPRTTVLEDYLGVGPRGLLWGMSLLAPLGSIIIVVMALTPYYQAPKFWWEGVLVLPLVPVAIMWYLEETARIAERPHPTRQAVLDQERVHAAGTAGMIVGGAAGIAWFLVTWSNLVGVAEMSGPKPSWVHLMPVVCRAMAALSLLLGAGVMFTALQRRQTDLRRVT